MQLNSYKWPPPAGASKHARFAAVSLSLFPIGQCATSHISASITDRMFFVSPN
ncbi:hypothetical protein FHS21_002571 [Phyllobacterium trifolii]|uniref:Uncharacterized protein n=1 Tax=Phyllobacterium trifolii TaxID=300193 RepID=A0A839U4Z6_9HYPH|nr:hypothetical protein [Phyllobacterium trifolii]